MIPITAIIIVDCTVIEFVDKMKFVIFVMLKKIMAYFSLDTTPKSVLNVNNALMSISIMENENVDICL